ncbi:YqeG family HAD IIIA-type phosphatase [Paenibacillus sp. MBLB4367]|uniref:YqeG family HAD IIIA-type phosphatase n=1 Tax=Paenibacillus sp. MBLB4367 TaxID=3384767 RepID=UPI003908152E
MINKLVPRMQAKTVYDIDLNALRRAGIRGVITDLDNTLVGAKEPVATPKLVEWLNGLRESGFQVVIVSNNSEARVSKFAEPLTVPFIYSARKPMNVAFHKAMGIMGVTPQQTAVVGDQMLTDVLGGNRLGLFTILVQPIALKDEGFFTKINRTIEKAALSFMKK